MLVEVDSRTLLESENNVAMMPKTTMRAKIARNQIPAYRNAVFISRFLSFSNMGVYG